MPNSTCNSVANVLFIETIVLKTHANFPFRNLLPTQGSDIIILLFSQGHEVKLFPLTPSVYCKSMAVKKDYYSLVALPWFMPRCQQFYPLCFFTISGNIRKNHEILKFFNILTTLGHVLLPSFHLRISLISSHWWWTNTSKITSPAMFVGSSIYKA